MKVCSKKKRLFYCACSAPDAGGMGSIPGQGTKIPHAMQCGRKEKRKKKKKGERENTIGVTK